ncbi:MAG: hypothetical protein ACR2MB_16755 [Acidimicrobiales bacterium]
MSGSNNTTGSILRGVMAGVIGTVAMDLVWFSRYRRSGGEDGFGTWEFSSSAEGFDDAGAPAQVGKKLADAVGVDLPDDAADTTNNVVHWATGAQWGAAYGVATALADGGDLPLALALGPVACSTAYALLGAAGIYEPIWTYDAKTLTKDYTAHMVFGLATAAAYQVLKKRK